MCVDQDTDYRNSFSSPQVALKIYSESKKNLTRAVHKT